MSLIADYLKNDYSLVPIPIGKKGPSHSDWNTPSKCITSLNDIDLLEGMNIGLAHAYCSPVPTCAIDIDNYKEAKPWLAKYQIDLDSLLLADDAVVISSGKKYSLKLIYKLPMGYKPISSIKINGIDGKVALEFRCATRDGKTVQDLLPPSLHPSGNQYQWIGEGDPLSPPVIPKPLLEVWFNLITNQRVLSSNLKNESDNTRPETPRQIAIINDLLSYINADCSYETWRNVIWAILSTGWTCSESIAENWSRTASHRFTENEDLFWILINSYNPKREEKIGIGTIYYYARLGGWNG